MSIVERLYIPRLGIERLRTNVPVEEVAQVLIDESASKGIIVCLSSRPLEEIVRLASEEDENINVVPLLRDPGFIWYEERWSIGMLRMTRMAPPETDYYNLHNIVLACGKRFRDFAATITDNPTIVGEDVGFQSNSARDRLPIIGIRGRLHVHIIDGQHRTVRAVWAGEQRMRVLTAYRR